MKKIFKKVKDDLTYQHRSTFGSLQTPQEVPLKRRVSRKVVHFELVSVFAPKKRREEKGRRKKEEGRNKCVPRATQH